ncbi:MAG: proline--tRNA ligase [Chloroflexi bacterium]|nr:proline--tRNA ligase [Chloroflexota bacterium]MDA1004286.1 proline--tRNA ligase [Chloroflexota bacterium]
MRMSRRFGHTLREAPGDAETAGHALLLRGGFIDQLMSGVYSYLPLGWRVERKVEHIIREEMDAAGAQEVHLPVIQPIELWEKTGRKQMMGDVLFQLTDRRERGMALGPTHEEVITQLFDRHSSSYRDLPVTLYQIQTKFRDEARPRGGLVRVREFTMKDAYSFDLDDAGLDASYEAMFRAYHRIFTRCGVPVVAVEADSGAIGGKGSQEFIFLTEIGEDTIVMCDACDYAANAEKAEFVRPPAEPEEAQPLEPISTPGATTIEDLARFLDIPTARTAKAVFFMATRKDGRHVPVFAVVRGDLDVNEIKLMNALGVSDLRPMLDAEVAAHGLVAGYASPIDAPRGVEIVADLSIPSSPNLVAGANRADAHLRNVNYERDWTAGTVADIALAQPGHRCPRCEGGTLQTGRGIEMGHVFRLNYTYTDPMDVSVLGADGKPVTPTMGCYGIGLGRIVAAAVEQHHDDKGVAWPASIAPYDVHLVGLGLDRDEDVRVDADRLYDELTAAGIEVLFDDRGDSPGVKFNDADLLGMPIRLTVSSRNHKAGVVELQLRDGGRPAEPIARADAAARVRAFRDELFDALRPA